MRYASELRDIEDLKIPKKMEVKEKELDLAMKLINAMTEKFKPEEYTDDYVAALKKVIDSKKAHKSIKVKDIPAPNKTDISKIIDELEKSLKEYSLTSKK
jgi:DNA end-binding protein Ku